MPWRYIFIHQRNGAKTSRVAQVHRVVVVAVSLIEDYIGKREIIDRKFFNVFFMLRRKAQILLVQTMVQRV